MEGEKKYGIFIPKNTKDLRVQYPELLEYPEFKNHIIKMHDVLFVWWYACACSPGSEIEDDQLRMEYAASKAYPIEHQRNAKLMEFSSKFPDNIKAAVKRMESYNTEARIEAYLQTKSVRDNCKEMLAANVGTMSQEEKDAWAKRAPGLWKLFEETNRTLERGAYGVSEYEEEMIEEAEGALRQFRNTRA